MRRWILAITITAASVATSLLTATPASAAGIKAVPVISGLSFPAAFTFSPNGHIFYGARFSGAIKILNLTTHNVTTFYTVTHLSTNGEQGLLGIALDPNYPASPYVYAYATRNVSGGLRNQILRIQYVNGHGTNAKVIFASDTTPGQYHDGGRILFGPDGMLYAIVGESHYANNSQNLNNNAGKILRMTPTGGVPGDNPIPGNRIYAYGIRNSFGFTFDYANTGNLWETENGPECNDELNRIIAGRNFGWGPSENCSGSHPQDTNGDGPSPVLPLRWWTPTIAPTGAVFCANCRLTGSGKDLFFGAYNTGDIRRVVLDGARTGVASMQIVLHHPSGILSMERSPAGTIYFSDAQGIFRLANG